MFQTTFLNNEITQSNTLLDKLLQVKIIIAAEANLIKLSIQTKHLENIENLVVV